MHLDRAVVELVEGLHAAGDAGLREIAAFAGREIVVLDPLAPQLRLRLGRVVVDSQLREGHFLGHGVEGLRPRPAFDRTVVLVDNDSRLAVEEEEVGQAEGAHAARIDHAFDRPVPAKPVAAPDIVLEDQALRPRAMA